MATSNVTSYGVLEQRKNKDDIDRVIEELTLNGYSILKPEFSAKYISMIAAKFDVVFKSYIDKFGSRIAKCSGEDGIIRCMPLYDKEFLNLLFNDYLHDLLKRILGDFFICNQVNGLINKANDSNYSQLPWHRDLPFRHLTMSKPVAINALYAVDDFTEKNGCTQVIPGSHKIEEFSSNETIENLKKKIVCNAGDFIIMDCMTFHSGSLNTTNQNRRAINHVFTIPAFRQQLHLSSVLKDFKMLTDYQKKVLGFELDHYKSIDEWFDWRVSVG